MRKLAKSVVFVLSLVPLAYLIFIVLTGRTSANPAEDILLTTGIWALRFLLASLTITPLRRLTGWNLLIQYRRMLGLFAFFYASVHLLSYLVFDQIVMEAGAVGRIVADIVKRPFITAGMTAFALMIPLAVTSTRGWIRRLGRRWQLLHRLIYFSGAAACLHFIWKVKVVVGEPVYYALILALLLGFRLAWKLRTAGRVRPQTAGA
jgi:sulfoxide reductase heme-binding subunit YedZ